MKKELVKNWMTADVVTISPEATLPDAHRIMIEQEVRRLPVVTGDGRLEGIVTLGDVRGAEPSEATTLSIWEMNYLLGRLTVGEIMTRTPVTVINSATIGTVARLMLENRIGGVPVVNEMGKLEGIITESDIFSMVILHEWGLDVSEQALETAV